MCTAIVTICPVCSPNSTTWLSTKSATTSGRRRPPTASPGTTSVTTARPGQGVLTGRPTIGLSLVLISPKEPERAQELRDWADFVHIRHIAEVAVPGYAMITPYENAAGDDPRFMHFYEMDTDDPERAFKRMTPLVMDRIGGAGTDAFKRWAFGPSLRIMYVNSFLRVGDARHAVTRAKPTSSRSPAGNGPAGRSATYP